MSNLYLADLKNMSEDEIKSHIESEYAGTASGFDYGEISEGDTYKVKNYLKHYDLVVAYESVGDWGCDSASYFLIRNKTTGDFEEWSGSHCSCYGFEGQFDPQPVDIEYLKSDRFNFYCGGYDDEETENQKAVKEFIVNLGGKP